MRPRVRKACAANPAPDLAQCAKCPWKVSTDPTTIPGGYSKEKHEALTSTIQAPGSFAAAFGPVRVMACHETPVGAERPCSGWLANQLGIGNNLGLRLKAMDGRYKTLRTFGPQHPNLEATFPKPKAR